MLQMRSIVTFHNSKNSYYSMVNDYGSWRP